MVLIKPFSKSWLGFHPKYLFTFLKSIYWQCISPGASLPFISEWILLSSSVLPTSSYIFSITSFTDIGLLVPALKTSPFKLLFADSSSPILKYKSANLKYRKNLHICRRLGRPLPFEYLSRFGTLGSFIFYFIFIVLYFLFSFPWRFGNFWIF